MSYIKPLTETIVSLVKTLGHELPQPGDHDAIPTTRGMLPSFSIKGPPSSPRQKSSVVVVTVPIVHKLLRKLEKKSLCQAANFLNFQFPYSIVVPPNAARDALHTVWFINLTVAIFKF